MNSRMRLLDPIGVIALFAGLSEASAATVLPYLDNENRQAYIWFLIIFPSFLVLLFFLTLNFNPTALYPPSTLCPADDEPSTCNCWMNSPRQDRDPSFFHDGVTTRQHQNNACEEQQNL
ncbi:hypothetical protein TRP66_07315 [Pseudomonas sp. JDS28PS106]|uniref:hypothetical protein n=1 Tax=Pseudomonas sp. JDS28PS106 TaxID=2497235 RepID=UPI002FCFF986